MFITSFRLTLENEHIGVDIAWHVRTLQCVIHVYSYSRYNILFMKVSKTKNRVSTGLVFQKTSIDFPSNWKRIGKLIGIHLVANYPRLRFTFRCDLARV